MLESNTVTAAGKSERCHYVDVAKGILILLVVLHHQPMIDKVNGIENSFLHILSEGSNLYNAFFMPAFFVLTGYCTNFQSRSLPKFCLHQFITIMLPAFCLGAMSVWLQLIGEGCTDPIEYCKIGFRTFAVQGGAFWFLPALLISKVLYKLWLSTLAHMNIRKKHTLIVLTFILCLLLHALGCLCEQQGFNNVWYYQHALALTIFLFVGRILKEWSNKHIYWSASIVYIVVISSLLIVGIEHPYITHGFKTTFGDMPPYLLLSVSGSIMTIYVAHLIQKSSLLEFYGRGSIIVYCLHLPIFFAIQNAGKHLLGMDTVQTVPFTIIQLALCLLVLAVMIRLLNMKRLQILQGRLPWKIV